MNIHVDHFRRINAQLEQDMLVQNINNGARFQYLEKSVASIQKDSYCETENLNFKIVSLEKELTKSQQYNRRESVEISGIPENISQDNLEIVIIDILRRIGVWWLSSFEIAACHRLNRKVGNESVQRVIIRFTNRKRSYQCFSGRKYLNDIWEYPNIYIHESLCFKMMNLYDDCMELKSQGIIKKLWTHNGIINIKKTDSYYERPYKIYHDEDITRYFANTPG